ncbi:MAG: hypothetical protein QGH98_10030, partial [Nitrospinaceae bacterium]|nr:hypothetical protein [Nitrospinaceae bacterium]
MRQDCTIHFKSVHFINGNKPDEYTRECLALKVARRLRSQDVLEQLGYLFIKSIDTRTKSCH